MTESSPPPATRRERFAAWRRQRPFAGAVLTVLSGIVLWFSGRLQLDNFEFHLGIEGMQSTLLPVALVALGALVLAQPQFRVFYGVITLAVAVYSLLGVNLGGFGIGMILGVVGGVLMVSWLPRPAPAPGAASDDAGGDGSETSSTSEGESERNADAFDELLPFDDAGTHGAGTHDAGTHEAVGTDDASEDDGRSRGGRHAAVVAAVAVLAVGGTGATATEATAATVPAQVRTADCWDPLGWLEWACGGDEATPSPSPSPSASDDTPTGDQAGDGTDGTSAPTSDPATQPDATGGGTDGAASEDGGTGDEADSAGDGKDGADGNGSADKGSKDGDDPSKADSEDEVAEAARLELGPCARITFGDGYDISVSLPGDCGRQEDANTFSLDADLEARDLQLPLTGINGIDVVNVPVTNDGPRRDALRLSVDSVKVPGFWLKTYAYGGDDPAGTVTNAGYVSMDGNAQMYISSIHANLPDGEDLAELGDKLSGGASLIEILLGLTDARIGLMGATSDVQVWSDFREQVWSD